MKNKKDCEAGRRVMIKYYCKKTLCRNPHKIRGPRVFIINLIISEKISIG